jgi:hypothetical protein
MPVRIAQIGKYRALPADFEKVPFEQYLFVDNLFQGYLNTQSDELLLKIAQVLYASDDVLLLHSSYFNFFLMRSDGISCVERDFRW